MEVRINAEWDPLRKVVMHRPGIEMFFGLLDPAGSLYERAFSQKAATAEHETLSEILANESGVNVEMLCESIVRYAKKGSGRIILEEKALSSIDFSGTTAEINDARKQFRKNIESYDADYLLNVIMLMPRLVLKKSRGIGAIHLSVTERDPLSNLYFMRDQQAVTDHGLFISRMAKPQRRKESGLTSMLWKMKGLRILHEASAPATFEGGDFFPLGSFALLGIGDRTNAEGASQMMKYGQSFPEIGIVRQPKNPFIPKQYKDPMLDMHLDTYFNVAGKNIAVGSETLLKLASVDVYMREGDSYRKIEGRTNLYDYLKSRGFDVIGLSMLEQMSYASNFLCIKDRRILAVESSSIFKKTLSRISEMAKRSPKHYGALFRQAKREYSAISSKKTSFPNRRKLYEYGIDYISVEVGNLTGGYGGTHCMTAVVERF